MYKITSDHIITENRLFIYFSENKNIYLSSKLIKALDLFVEYNKAEDKFNHRTNFELIKSFYFNSEYNNRKDLLKQNCFSEAALSRFRVKIIDRLTEHLKSIVDDDVDNTTLIASIL